MFPFLIQLEIIYKITANINRLPQKLKYPHGINKINLCFFEIKICHSKLQLVANQHFRISSISYVPPKLDCMQHLLIVRSSSFERHHTFSHHQFTGSTVGTIRSYQTQPVKAARLSIPKPFNGSMVWHDRTKNDHKTCGAHNGSLQPRQRSKHTEHPTV